MPGGFLNIVSSIFDLIVKADSNDSLTVIQAESTNEATAAEIKDLLGRFLVVFVADRFDLAISWLYNELLEAIVTIRSYLDNAVIFSEGHDVALTRASANLLWCLRSFLVFLAEGQRSDLIDPTEPR